MESFALSERWNGWSRLDVMVEAARAAIAAGPLDPLVCEVVLEWDDDTSTLDNVVEAEASLTLVYNGRGLQINGSGSDWQRARQAYDAAQVELAMEYGITTFKRPTPPRDTVAETRKRLNKPPQD